MKDLRISLLLFGLVTLFVACSTSEIEAEATPPPPPPTSSTTTYNKDVRTVINNSCATSACHDATAPSAGLPLTNYTQVRNAAENGNMIARINSSSNPMPPSGKNNAIVTLINEWRNDGYLEN